jgi:uncharacterized membrane protein
MSIRGLSKRRLKKLLRRACEGIAIGLVASIALISGTAVIVRLIIGAPIGHRMPLGCVFFIGVLIAMIYRLWHIRPEPSRSRRFETYGTVTELSADDKTKSA